MDTERTMQFILDNVAALTVSQQRTDRQVAGLQTLMKTGMRMLVKLQQSHQKLEVTMAELAKAQVRTDHALAELAAQHKRTDQKFERWIDSMNRGSNGHKKKPN